MVMAKPSLFPTFFFGLTAIVHSLPRVAVQALKKERAECMWKALERIIPDVRKRTEVELVATPLTHEFFNRRFKGENSLAESLCFVPKPCSPGTRAWTHVARIFDELHMGNAFVACHW